MRTLALLLAASVAAATVYPGESSQWQIGSGDEHGVEPVPSDAVNCSPTSFGVLYFGGTGGNAYAEIIFTGNIAVYGLVSPSGGPVQVFVDDALAFAFDEQLQVSTSPVHCAYMGTWMSPPEIDTFTAHTLRVVYSGDAQHRGFIVNATTSSAHTLPPFTTIISPASSSITVTAVPFPTQAKATGSRHTGISPRATYLIPIICLLVGVVLGGLALWGLTSWWRKRRALRAPSAAFRAEAHAHERGGHSFPWHWQRRSERQPQSQMSEKAPPAPVVAPEAGPSTV